MIEASSDTFKWLATQSDRVLFLATLVTCGWFVWRQQGRSERVIDDMAKLNESTQKMYHDEMREVTEHYFEMVKDVEKIISTHTELMRENIAINRELKTIMEQVKARLQ